MSSETQFDQQTTAIRDEIRRTTNQLGQLAESERNFEVFCSQVLSHLVRITGAHQALLWQHAGQHPPQLTHQECASNGVAEQRATAAAAYTAADNPTHQNLLNEVIQQNRPLGLNTTGIADENRSQESNHDAPNQREQSFVLLFSPVYRRGGQYIGTLELVQRGDITPAAQEGYLRFLIQISQIFQRWYEHQDFAKLTEHADQWGQKLAFVTETHRYLDVRETAYAIANEARRLLGCDRVSVAYFNGSCCKLKAISGQDRFDNRANVIGKLQRVATSSVTSNSPFWIMGDTSDLAPEVADQINEYLDEAHSRTLIVLPLTVDPPARPDLEMQNRRPAAKKIGALIIEYFDDDVSEERISETKELIVSQAALALDNSRKHSEVFLLPIFERLGKLQTFLFRDHLAKSMTGLAALVVLTLFLIFYPTELKMRVDGVIRPTLRQTVFTEFDQSIIREVLVDEQSSVTKGDVLLRLENPDLDLRLVEVEGQIKSIELQREILIQRRSQTQLAGQPSDREANLSDLELMNAQLQILRQQLRLLEEKKERLDVKSPISGTVITPQPKRRLINFPVSANLAVLEIVDYQGPWELDLKIPQRKVGYVATAQKYAAPEPLFVEFRLGSDPNLVLKGTLVSVSERAIPSASGTTEFKALVKADEQQFEKLQDALRTGTGVTAKIHCGQRSLGFVCFYQVIDWLRTNVLF